MIYYLFTQFYILTNTGLEKSIVKEDVLVSNVTEYGI